MKNVTYIDGKRFYIESDSSLIRDEELYCAIKDRVNRRSALPKGSFDWAGLYSDAEILAEGAGVDLIIASYYAVAAFNTKGFKGLANGLTLMNTAILNQQNDDLKQYKLNKGLIDWVRGQIIKDVSALEPTYESLRDLYRCERECQILEEISGSQEYSNESCFEDVALEVLRHIEHLELHYHKTERVRVVEKLSSFSWNDTALVVAASFISIVFTVVIMTYLPRS